MADTQAEAASGAGSLKRSGLAVVGLICGIVSMVLCFIPVVGLLVGLAALFLGILARKAIKRSSVLRGKGIAKASFVLGIIGTVLGVVVLMIAIPNYLNMGRRSFDNTTRSNMQKIQWILDDFADSTKGVYPTSKKNGDTDTCRLSDLVPYLRDDELENPYNHRPCNIVLMSELSVFPTDNEVVDIPPGDIRVYSNGNMYLILGGDGEGKSMAHRLNSVN